MNTLKPFLESPYWAFDLLALAVLIGVTVFYAHRGFLADIWALVGNFLSIAVALSAAKVLAGAAFQNFLAPGITKNVIETLSQPGQTVEDVISQYAGFLPEALRESLIAGLDEALSPTVEAMARQVVSRVIEPLLVPILTIVLFFVGFAVLRLLVSLIAALLKAANHLPVAGKVNRTLGAVLGLAAGVLDVFLLLCAVWAIVAVTGDTLPGLNSALFEKSLVGRLFAAHNPFLLSASLPAGITAFWEKLG